MKDPLIMLEGGSVKKLPNFIVGWETRLFVDLYTNFESFSTFRTLQTLLDWGRFWRLGVKNNEDNWKE